VPHSAPDAAERPEPPAAPAGTVAASPAPEPSAPAPESPETATATPHSAAPAERPQVPLRSLNRYRQDPAFKNFMAKAQKKPGTATRRPGIPGDYLDRERRPR
jgi:hypothetical protein